MARHAIVGGMKIRQINLSRKTIECPQCKTFSKRRSLGHRWLRDIGVGGPLVLEITYSKHYCPKCEKHFNLPMDHLAYERSNFTKKVTRTAIDMVVNKNMTLNQASEAMKEKHHACVPATTIHDWVVKHDMPQLEHL